jgi:hypothetical protein
MGGDQKFTERIILAVKHINVLLRKQRRSMEDKKKTTEGSLLTFQIICKYQHKPQRE